MNVFIFKRIKDKYILQNKDVTQLTLFIEMSSRIHLTISLIIINLRTEIS